VCEITQDAVPTSAGDPKPEESSPSLDSTASQAQQETVPPMLDVHPVHGPVMGWREFFTHILIIAIGLCLALGLQESVEYLHRRHELDETRAALRLEREENHKVLARQTVAWRWGVAEMQNNLVVLQYLQQHPGTPQDKLPGVLLWKFQGLNYSTAVWDAARQTGVAALMSREEIEQNNDLYAHLQMEFELVVDAARALTEAQRFALLDSDPSHLTPTEVAEEIRLTQAVLTKHAFFGSAMNNLRDAYPDFPPTVTRAELEALYHPPDRATQEQLSAPRAATMQRMRASGYTGSGDSP
jgi:hypothetical protein